MAVDNKNEAQASTDSSGKSGNPSKEAGNSNAVDSDPLPDPEQPTVSIKIPRFLVRAIQNHEVYPVVAALNTSLILVAISAVWGLRAKLFEEVPLGIHIGSYFTMSINGFWMSVFGILLTITLCTWVIIRAKESDGKGK